jgi:hypothetical protein
VARADAVHAATKRKEPAFGPPRPPPKPQQQHSAARAPADDPSDGGAGDIVGPPRPPAGDSSSDSDLGGGSDGGGEQDDEEGEDEEEGGDPYRLPVSNEVVLSGFERAVTCLDVEHTGSRVAVGGIDNTVRLYDFNGMRSDLRPFRWVSACGLRGRGPCAAPRRAPAGGGARRAKCAVRTRCAPRPSPPAPPSQGDHAV